MLRKRNTKRSIRSEVRKSRFGAEMRFRLPSEEAEAIVEAANHAGEPVSVLLRQAIRRQLLERPEMEA